ncbi:putative caspase-like protein [Bradyrhizobium sp. USDA 4454]
MRWTLLAAGLLAMLFASPAAADKRVALVVGNSTYQNVARLQNPNNDAQLAETLQRLGFALVGGQAQVDLDKASFDSAIQRFGSQLMGADVALFYYAGHGIQVRGTR